MCKAGGCRARHPRLFGLATCLHERLDLGGRFPCQLDTRVRFRLPGVRKRVSTYLSQLGRRRRLHLTGWPLGSSRLLRELRTDLNGGPPTQGYSLARSHRGKLGFDSFTSLQTLGGLLYRTFGGKFRASLRLSSFSAETLVKDHAFASRPVRRSLTEVTNLTASVNRQVTDRLVEGAALPSRIRITLIQHGVDINHVRG